MPAEDQFDNRQDVAEAYRMARETEHPMFADAPILEFKPADREWAMIRLVDLQTACAFGQNP